MSDTALAPLSGDTISLLPQDRGRSWTRLFTLALSILVLVAAAYQLRSLDPALLLQLIPSAPAFWLLFLVLFLAGPISEWFIFRRLWGVGLAALGALTRKLAYNELLLGYLGEAWFYAWARKNTQIKAAPFGAVKDVAVLSAMAGNLMTLVLILLALPFVDLLPLGEHVSAIAWSLAFVLGTSLAAMIWRKTIFSLTRDELTMVFAVHVARIVFVTLVSAALWHMVLPDTALGWWLVLAAIRLLISRLPFIPNKDLVFAGVAVLAVGSQPDIAALIAMMAGLILAANVTVGLGFALADLAKGEQSYAPAR